MNNLRSNFISLIITLGLVFSLLTGCTQVSETLSSNVDATVENQSNTATSGTEASQSNDKTGTNNTSSEASTSSNVKVHFINVGQADSILIQDEKVNMLIDAGNNADANMVVNYLKNQNVTKLDYVIGTHPHEDHIGALDEVIKSFDIGNVYMPKVTHTTKTFKDVVTAIKNKGLSIKTPVPGTKLKLNTASATILAPNGSTYEDLNNNSIVIKLVNKNTSFLFTGDAEDVSENEMINKGFDLTADVLKVGHHGSSSSTTTGFLNKVNPTYAVIMTEKGNDYGHPHKETMDKLKNKGVTVYRTDESGTIVATSDGNTITFSTKPGSYLYGNSSSKNTSNNTSTLSKSINSTSNISSNNKPTGTTTKKPAASASSNKTVYFTPKGKSYHLTKECRTLSRSKVINSGTLQEAISSGHADPCDICTN